MFQHIALNTFILTEDPWIIDSRATDHMTGSFSLFLSYSPCAGNKKIWIADGSLSPIVGRGSIRLSKCLSLHNVLHGPKLSCNLLSISQLLREFNCCATFSKSFCAFQDSSSGKIIGSAKNMEDSISLRVLSCMDNPNSLHASHKKFQEILEEALIRPLNLDGELYIGIPPGVESRLATLTVDMDEIHKFTEISRRPDLPSTFQNQIQDVSQIASTLPALFNTLNTRRAIIPAANAHCSARALARYYAALVDKGTIPPPHSSSTKPALGSHPHIPKFPSPRTSKKRTCFSGGSTKKSSDENYSRVPSNDTTSNGSLPDYHNNSRTTKLFNNSNIHDEFLGVGEYEALTLLNGQFGLGFKRSYSEDGTLIGFGHSGMGGSTGYCDINNRFAISVTLNKMNLGGVTAKVMKLVCSELDIPLPADFYRFTERIDENEVNMAIPLIN